MQQHGERLPGSEMGSNGNSQRYNFADFTQANYRLLLRQACRRFSPCSFVNFSTERNGQAIWRHDIDFSVHESVAMAEIEAEEGVSATYFFLLHSECYNLIERETTARAREIVGHGHRAGLHLDTRYWPIRSEEDFVAVLARERVLLQDVLQAEVKAFAFHIPGDDARRFDELVYDGMVNAYARVIMSHLAYCSDSNGYWRFRSLAEVLADPTVENVQAVIHPEYWTETVTSPRERFERCVSGQAERARRWYRDTLAESRREDVDW